MVLHTFQFQSVQCSICRGLGVLPPSGASRPPSLTLTPTDLVKKSQKYIANRPSGFTTNRLLISIEILARF